MNSLGRCSTLRSGVVGFAAALSVLCGPAVAQSPSALHVFLETACPSEPPKAGQQAGPGALLVEALATNLVGGLVDAAGSYLSAAATAKSTSLRGSAEDTFYTLSDTGDLGLKRGSGCLVLLVPGKEAPTAWYAQARARTLLLNPYANLPRFYAELEFERLDPASPNLVVRPRILHVSEFLESSWSSRGTRTYSLAVTLRGLSDGVAFGTATFAFDDVQPGTRGVSKVVDRTLSGTETLDNSIVVTLSPAAARVSLLPRNTDIEASVTAQKLAAAPFQKVQRILSNEPPVVLLEPEQALTAVARQRPDPNKVKAFGDALTRYCTSLEGQLKDKKPGAVADARCPLSHLQAANDLEEARASLKDELETAWARSFARANPKRCTASGTTWSCKPPPPGNSDLGPYSWEVALVETREPAAFAVALASAFSANKEKLKSALQEELPSKKEEAKRNDEQAKRDAIATFRLAMLDVEKAEARLAEAAAQPRSGQIPLQAEVLKAKVAANAAARAAGQPEPFVI